jgi:hypothetical protein
MAGPFGKNMVQRSLVTFLAALGGLLVILGGILGFLLSLGPHGFGDRFGDSGGALLFGILAVIFGLVILVFSGFTHFSGVERNMTGGLILAILGIVTWVVVGDWLLVAVGSFLAVLAGLVLIAEVLMSDSRIRVTS